MVKQHRNNLFNDCELSVIFENVYNSIIPQVEAITDEEFFSASDDELVESLLQQNSINQIVLHEDKIRMSKPALCRLTPAGRIYRPTNGQDPPDLKDGMITQVEIPYSGDKRLLVSKPSMHYTHGGPSFTIKDDRIIKYYVRPLYSDPKSFKDHFLRNYVKINKYLDWQAHDIAHFEKRLNTIISTAISDRRNRESTIDLHLAAKPGATEFTPAHFRNRLTNKDNQPTHTTTPVISDEDFIKAIRVLRHTGNSFERTPSIYKVHNDQDLRNILVSNLNTHFTGENNEDLFERAGENGFTVSFANQPAFLSKCFTWHCREGLIYSINQLLGEKHCQSCKIIIAIFNRTEPDFKELLKLIEKIFSTHPCYEHTELQFADNEWQTVMHAHGDLNRKHWVHFMIFNLFFTKEQDPLHLSTEEREFLAKL